MIALLLLFTRALDEIRNGLVEGMENGYNGEIFGR